MRHNHDTSYNKDLPHTGIQHVEYESFESILNNFDSFMLDHARMYEYVSFIIIIMLTVFLILTCHCCGHFFRSY